MHEVMFVFTEPCMYEGFLADIGRIKKIWMTYVLQPKELKEKKKHILFSSNVYLSHKSAAVPIESTSTKNTKYTKHKYIYTYTY